MILTGNSAFENILTFTKGIITNIPVEKYNINCKRKREIKFSWREYQIIPGNALGTVMLYESETENARVSEV